MRVSSGTLAFITLACSLQLVGSEALAFRGVFTRENAHVRWSPEDAIRVRVQQPVTDNPNCQVEVSDTEVRDAVLNAFNTWENAANDLQVDHIGSIQPADAGKTGYNDTIFICDDWSHQPFGGSQVLALTITTFKTGSGEITKAIINFNGQHYRWGDATIDETVVDIQNIATHEVGHSLGLDHSSDSPGENIEKLAGAAMYYASSEGDLSARTLNEDDINGLRNVYGHTVASPVINDFEPKVAEGTDYNFTMTLHGDFHEQSQVRLYNAAYAQVVIGKIIDGGNDFLVAEFNLTQLGPGEADLIVNNSYENENAIANALTVTGSGTGSVGSGSVELAQSSGGCGVVDVAADSPSPSVYLIMLIFPMTLLLLRNRKPSVTHNLDKVSGTLATVAVGNQHSLFGSQLSGSLDRRS